MNEHSAALCCDFHNRNCEPPSELCCNGCTEAAHPHHYDHSICIAPDLSVHLPPFEPSDCSHEFTRDGWQLRGTLLPRRKWRCASCGLTTRTYDAVDRMTRPPHRRMPIALPGFNTRRPTGRGAAR